MQTTGSAIHLHISEREGLIEISTSGSLKIDFTQKSLTGIALHREYPALANRAVKTLMSFATTYLCESGFSALTSIKVKYQHRLIREGVKTQTLAFTAKHHDCKKFETHWARLCIYL